MILNRLKTPRKSITSIQREEQARSPTKSEWDSGEISLMVQMGSNPSGSRPNFFGRQHLAFDKGRAWMPEVERPKALSMDA
ncbi:MAG: hypothetical protein EGR74_10805 [Ruminiclostridium sp.]|nr:hypothetical protein [Ruminiclostridium sp.]